MVKGTTAGAIAPMPPSATTFNWATLQNGSDIRGVALEGVPGEPVNLTPEVVTTLGQAFATWLSAELDLPLAELTIAIGRDSRLSGPELMAAAIAGISNLGCRVLDVAMASTPAMFMATVLPEFACHGAIMMTASHLPFNRNGLKFFTRRGGLGKKEISRILALAEQGNFAPAAPGPVERRDLIGAYAAGLVQQIRQAVNHPDQFEQPLRGLKIIVDAGNGAGGFFASQVLAPLGADTTGSQFLDPDGTFPNHVPNPEDAAAIASICQAVVAQGADFGLIFDTDVDRGAAVDGDGRELNRNRLIALIAAIVLQEHPGTTIVTDSTTSDGLTRFIEGHLGGIHHRFRRGYKNVINEAIRLNEAGQPSWLAIEASGHGAMKENYFLDDGAYLVSKLLVELAKTRLNGQRLTDLIAPLQDPHASREYRLKILAPEAQVYGAEVMNQLKDFVATQADWAIEPSYEGVRVSCSNPDENGWFMMRMSLHDPVLPLNVESNVAGGVAKVGDRLTSFFETLEGLDISALGT
ncbi:phosphomannomutase/phosphoglucomutase [Nodosilinea sp. PGN35]|uniref:phosphomannomutase/phosphoglucomutase n=1 Tax=Nodosilinea sp. PGN35 TaxID=3020489 RepID=UPI0023B238C2|nr:phosphomannomutase/phosphoglucomutase [Nodosilinea sp. TSF1-S3]MDF0366686.1 phosphomannomutase/phosphoglucomutase [Nodosilinea sp. TSF1-S3]